MYGQVGRFAFRLHLDGAVGFGALLDNALQPFYTSGRLDELAEGEVETAATPAATNVFVAATITDRVLSQ